MGSAQEETLTRAAREAVQNALAPYSGFKVGAALLASSGNIYSGCNIENPSLMLTICAERVALMKALSEGEREFRAIAVVSSADNPCFPCGTCRQMLMEYAPAIEVHLTSESGIQTFPIKDLLPHPFRKEPPSRASEH
jgi:homotetrameric cytidine deaminase